MLRSSSNLTVTSAGEFCALNDWKAKGYELGTTERPVEGPIRPAP